MRISDWSSDVCSSDLLHAGIVERTDDGGDSDTITAELLQGPLLDRPPGLAPELANPAARLLQHRVGQLQQLKAQPAADLHGPARLPQPRQRRRLAACDPPCMLPHPVDRQIRDHRSEEHTSELQSLMRISDAVFCSKKKQI